MKIIELFEEDETDHEAELQDAIKIIKRDCKPFLEQFEGRFLFRGSNSFVTGKGPTKFFQKRSVRTDRKPMNTDDDIHKVTDDWFNEKFGIRGRSGAMFATGNFGEARAYGTVYCIFPIGDFKFVWSPVVKDLFVAGRDINSAKDAVPYLDKAGYRDTDFGKAIKSGKEIMIACKEYYMLLAQTVGDRYQILNMLGDDEDN